MPKLTAPILVLILIALPAHASAKCPPDAAQVGPTCVDTYEASIWQIPASATSLVKRVQKGKATRQDLLAGGATQLGAGTGGPCSSLEYPATFPVNGSWTEPVYAVSVPGVVPSTCMTWYQAEQACALSGKRLITNQEWQRAVAGTPDPSSDNGVTDCNYASTLAPGPAGARIACVSRWGVYDMIGNVAELTADWDERATACTFHELAFGGDSICMGGGSDGEVGVLIRSGHYDFGVPNLGAFFLSAALTPESHNEHVGFRCAR